MIMMRMTSLTLLRFVGVRVCVCACMCVRAGGGVHMHVNARAWIANTSTSLYPTLPYPTLPCLDHSSPAVRGVCGHDNQVLFGLDRVVGAAVQEAMRCTRRTSGGVVAVQLRWEPCDRFSGGRRGREPRDATSEAWYITDHS
jgi:hypothetical protein